MTLNRIILHADLDCFYCQVEQIRLNIPSTIPLAIQQWENIIAVNYAARSFGIARHSFYRNCLKICPQIKLVHVATYDLENGCELKQYEPNKDDKEVIVPDRMKFKASLDPYRKAGLEILSRFKRFSDIVEKASVDEAFLDVTKEVDQELEIMLQQQSHSNDNSIFDIWSKLDWYQKAPFTKEKEMKKEEEKDPTIHNDSHQDESNNNNNNNDSDMLPIIPLTCSVPDSNSDPSGFSIAPLPQLSELEMKNEIRIWIAGKIASNLRATIFKELGYTCSIGIARNKTLAKIASAKHKPNKQTFVLDRQVESLMRQVPLCKIRFLGGKMGDLLLSKATFEKSNSIINNNKKRSFNSISANDDIHSSSSSDEDDNSNEENDNDNDKIIHGTNDDSKSNIMASDFWSLSISDLQGRTGLDESASKWIYNVIRGIDDSPVHSRTQTKTFQSTKNLSPAIKEWSHLKKWLPVLCTELKFRIEEDVEINNRWPQSLLVVFKSLKTGTHRRSVHFPRDRNFKVELLVGLAEEILERQQDLLPCSLIAIGVSRFISSISSIDFNNSSLDKFLVKTTNSEKHFERFEIEGIADTIINDNNNNDENVKKEEKINNREKKEESKKTQERPLPRVFQKMTRKENQKNKFRIRKEKINSFDGYFKPISPSNEHVNTDTNDPSLWKCTECGKMFSIDHVQEHQDYHFALSIQYKL